VDQHSWRGALRSAEGAVVWKLVIHLKTAQPLGLTMFNETWSYVGKKAHPH
jgi:hypothetical protein